MRDQALLVRERRIEAEALIENVKARIRYSQPQKAPKFGLLLLLLGLNLTLAVAQQTTPRQPDVKFVPTPRAAVRKMLKLASVKPSDVVYDLGCGDGRMVITAAKRYGVRGVGIDIDPERIRQSRKNARKAGVEHLVSFRNEDLFDADISEATVVTLYLLHTLNLKLRPKLWKELKPGARIVSYNFDMGYWPPEKQVLSKRLALELSKDGSRVGVTSGPIYLWTIPAEAPQLRIPIPPGTTVQGP